MLNPFLERQKRLSPEQTKLQDDLLSALSTDRDLYVTKMELTERAPIREVVSLHALNHVMR
jgi:U3 small nucleolar RNA-associated protein 25